MKMNKWTMGLAAAGVVSLASTAQAEENSVLTALSSTVIGGNVEASYVGGFSSSNNMHNDGGFEANGASLSIGSPLGEGDYGTGYNLELLLGARAGAFASDGSDYHLKNANIGLNLPVGNGVDLTVGLFDTIVGYEVEASGHNPNVMRSFGFIQGPRTHTGVLASTSLADGLSVSVGLTNGFDAATGLENNDGAQLGYILGAEFTVPDGLGFLGGSTVYVGYVNGNDEGNPNGAVSDDGVAGVRGDDNTLLYIGATINTPIEGVAVGVAYDDRNNYGNENNFGDGKNYDSGNSDSGWVTMPDGSRRREQSSWSSSSSVFGTSDSTSSRERNRVAPDATETRLSSSSSRNSNENTNTIFNAARGPGNYHGTMRKDELEGLPEYDPNLKTDFSQKLADLKGNYDKKLSEL